MAFLEEYHAIERINWHDMDACHVLVHAFAYVSGVNALTLTDVVEKRVIQTGEVTIEKRTVRLARRDEEKANFYSPNWIWKNIPSLATPPSPNSPAIRRTVLFGQVQVFLQLSF